MSQTTTSAADQEQGASPPERGGRKPPSRRTTRLGVAIGLILIAALVIFLLLSPPNPDARPVSLGFSYNSFFQWIGNLGPIVQIPIVLIVFAAVVGILLVLIEFAPRAGRGYFWLRLISCFAIPFLAFMLLRPYQGAVIYVIAIALVAGGLLFWADYRASQGAGYMYQLTLFMAPAAIAILVGLVYPSIATIVQSFFDKTGENFVGLENYVWAFTNPQGFWSIINTLIWAIFAPIFATVVGLAYAAFMERARGERLLKLLVFMPFAIAPVSISLIWKFVYDYRQGEQIGTLNAIVVAFGGQPVPWLDIWPLVNTFCLLFAFVWAQTGFAMVVLSAAMKAVPVEQLEAAQLDGTSAWQRFINVTVPGIRTSIIVVLTTVTIAALKLYDIVAVMTGGRANSTVLGFEMVNQQQRFQSYGHSAALAVLIFVFVTPLIVYNVLQLRKQREVR
ncbi:MULTISPECIES: carbohydrate ABC transporter permease [Microbacterium]|uniref:Lactose transport system permease protein LacF n=1 Tax=Microbacterium trichothecenolyticum TaxID=69370 RepID=A0A0M2H5D2_MICTR|nr:MULTISPECIES: sugar ABC transporter permease [Microbacterium]KJL41536.1 Lactose transport system permease protein LacF [Microbacterium trichothecenolyticum]MDR7190611.1 alpha-glucoside transport system permease protein [Microbacterium sp. BE35]